MTAEDLIYKLYSFFDVKNNLDLANKLETTAQTISNWKSRNSVNAIKKKCRELSIYNEIFGDLKLSTNEEQSNQELNNDIFSGIFPFWPQQIIVTEFDLENDICFAETDRVRKLVSFAANVL